MRTYVQYRTITLLLARTENAQRMCWLPQWLYYSQVKKNLPANAGYMGSILDQEDPLGKEMATHSSILNWKIPWTEESGRGLQKNQIQLND